MPRRLLRLRKKKKRQHKESDWGSGCSDVRERRKAKSSGGRVEGGVRRRVGGEEKLKAHGSGCAAFDGMVIAMCLFDCRFTGEKNL
ncbi:hypothetical protein AMTR_s00057p00209150 [Amborella trichopoda]|uniref:Uncharacterized protein n=1 Tax=Amborella trichopoda TaxID=13333 RepID=U5D6E1_AMBTC|nr:hypothetical protein AMTR_s00057p00209150 [Amborella trichopoda]